MTKPDLVTRRRWIAFACICEVLLIIVGIVGEFTVHRIVYLIVAGVFAVFLLVLIPVYRRTGRI